MYVCVLDQSQAVSYASFGCMSTIGYHGITAFDGGYSPVSVYWRTLLSREGPNLCVSPALAHYLHDRGVHRDPLGRVYSIATRDLLTDSWSVPAAYDYDQPVFAQIASNLSLMIRSVSYKIPLKTKNWQTQDHSNKGIPAPLEPGNSREGRALNVGVQLWNIPDARDYQLNSES